MKRLIRYLALPMAAMSVPHRVLAQVSQSQAVPGCEFSSAPKSSLAWESGAAEGRGPATPLGRDAIVGRIIAVRTGDPVANARIMLDPGGKYATSDSAGRFSFGPIAQGRYRVTVVSSFVAASISDSVTLGFDGLRMVAALAGYRGDIVCSVPARRPDPER